MKTIKLKVGKSSVITLASLATAGYLWTYQVDKNLIIAVSEERSATVHGNIKAGSSFPEKFLIKALKPGTVKLVFLQKRSWEQNTAAIATMVFAVIVT